MKKTDKLTRLLDFMEDNIDLVHIREIEQLQYDTIKYRDVQRLPLTVKFEQTDFEQFPLEEAYKDPEKMLYNEILSSTVHSSYRSVLIKDDSPLMVRSNHGVGIIASMFGCRPMLFNNQMPWVSHIGLAGAKKVFSKGLPDIKSALGKRVIETYQYYHDRLEAYPNCYKAIRLTQPDLQGPFDILHLILGEDAFYILMDDPALAVEMINIVSYTYVTFRREIDHLLTDRFQDSVFVHGYCCGGQVLIKSDTPAANLSSQMYKTYEALPNSLIFEEFKEMGGGSLHYCGKTKPWLREAIYSPNLRCINYGNPEMHKLSEEYAYWKNKKVAIVGWGNDIEYTELRNTCEKGDSGNCIFTGVTTICNASSVSNGREIVKKHRESSRLERNL